MYASMASAANDSAPEMIAAKIPTQSEASTVLRWRTPAAAAASNVDGSSHVARPLLISSEVTGVGFVAARTRSTWQSCKCGDPAYSLPAGLSQLPTMVPSSNLAATKEAKGAAFFTG
jgi:hypothetical protein